MDNMSGVVAAVRKSLLVNAGPIYGNLVHYRAAALDDQRLYSATRRGPSR